MKNPKLLLLRFVDTLRKYTFKNIIFKFIFRELQKVREGNKS